MTMNNTARQLSRKAAKARAVLYLSDIPYQSHEEKDYQAAMDLLAEKGMKSGDELKEASHWVGR